ncbi:MAG: glycosyltransferase [Sulfurimonas sp.]|uniref:glycosyltransferase n=1 Tax=Sulfurimonas sp. TaxID=2022749 RepID=UPI0025FB8557|nr:glycosyltransferase [Sulfurimonas sp.]MCK9490806.1 glycosyltransferase [Sulfurimonas sp.]
MQSKKRLLYITDQQEYSEHGTVGPLFKGYLKEYLDVNIIYFTKFKNSFQAKENDFVVPIQYKKEISCYLDSKGVDLSSYDYVFVRNKPDILKDVLANRQKYGYKVGYRLSFPKKEEYYEAQKAKNSATFIDSVKNYFTAQSKKNLLAQCDIFMPTSKDMEDTFYADSGVLSFPLPAGLDPAKIKPHKESDGEERHFIYVGTLDALRDFEKVLVAFSKLNGAKWHLNISTLDSEFARAVIAKYPSISDKITILKADTLDELREHIDACDVGIALLPNIQIYSTSIPAKTMDYYTCAIPTLLTDNPKNRTLFSDEDALFCEFKSDEIAKKLSSIIDMSQEDIAKMGHAGQEKLLHHKRNYKIMAKELYEKLESL